MSNNSSATSASIANATETENANAAANTTASITSGHSGVGDVEDVPLVLPLLGLFVLLLALVVLFVSFKSRYTRAKRRRQTQMDYLERKIDLSKSKRLHCIMRMPVRLTPEELIVKTTNNNAAMLSPNWEQKHGSRVCGCFIGDTDQTYVSHQSMDISYPTHKQCSSCMNLVKNQHIHNHHQHICNGCINCPCCGCHNVREKYKGASGNFGKPGFHKVNEATCPNSSPNQASFSRIMYSTQQSDPTTSDDTNSSERPAQAPSKQKLSGQRNWTRKRDKEDKENKNVNEHIVPKRKLRRAKPFHSIKFTRDEARSVPRDSKREYVAKEVAAVSIEANCHIYTINTQPLHLVKDETTPSSESPSSEINPIKWASTRASGATDAGDAPTKSDGRRVHNGHIELDADSKRGYSAHSADNYKRDNYMDDHNHGDGDDERDNNIGNNLGLDNQRRANHLCANHGRGNHRRHNHGHDNHGYDNHGHDNHLSGEEAPRILAQQSCPGLINHGFSLDSERSVPTVPTPGRDSPVPRHSSRKKETHAVTVAKVEEGEDTTGEVDIEDG